MQKGFAYIEKKGEIMNKNFFEGLTDGIAIICCTLLAIFFDKWWIALIGLLFVF